MDQADTIQDFRGRSSKIRVGMDTPLGSKEMLRKFEGNRARQSDPLEFIGNIKDIWMKQGGHAQEVTAGYRTWYNISVTFPIWGWVLLSWLLCFNAISEYEFVFSQFRFISPMWPSSFSHINWSLFSCSGIYNCFFNWLSLHPETNCTDKHKRLAEKFKNCKRRTYYVA